MTVKEIMERVGIKQSGRAMAYVKDALDEIALASPTHVNVVSIDIYKDQRFYDLPREAIKVLDIRCKHHDNEKSLYQSIPRSIHEPMTEDSDGK